MTDVKVGTELDFTKTNGWSKLGVAVVTNIAYGRVKDTYSLTTVRDGNVGANYKAAIRHGRSILDHGSVVGTNKKAAEKVIKKKQEVSEQRYQAAKVAEQWFEAGDIVRISSTDRNFSSWTMKVLVIDSVKGQIRGVCADHSLHQISGKLSSAPLAAKNVEITLVQKQAFNPETDPAVLTMQHRRAVTATKRATSRARREDLRKYFGGM